MSMLQSLLVSKPFCSLDNPLRELPKAKGITPALVPDKNFLDLAQGSL